MNEYWQEIEEIFKPQKYRDLFKLNDGASQSDLDNLESSIGLELPQSVKDFYRVHNGQEPYWQNQQLSPGMFFNWVFLPIEAIAQNWQTWHELQYMNQDIADDMSSYPEGHIKNLYTNDGWIPLIDDFGGNHVGIDLDPDINGVSGQLIIFGADENEKRLIASSFTKFLEKYLFWLKNKQWQIDDSPEWQISETDYQDFFYSYYA